MFATMWDDAGIVRDAAGLSRAAAALVDLDGELAHTQASGAREREFNLAWHDWLNLSNLIAVSRSIVRAGIARENSRGAHWRRDFTDPGDLASSTYTRVRQRDGALEVEAIPVRFTRVCPGEAGPAAG
ncbi:MAG: hypothetical protein GZ089_05900 [Aromatoleum sp.]|nr:hypothetical protein [Aromatoleum sp.]